MIADLQAQLFRAVQAGDLKTAQAINDRIYPLASVFYAQPWVDMHNRMKEALVLMGRLPRAVVRPPLVKIERAEIERIRKALVEAKLLPASATAISLIRGAASVRPGSVDASLRPGMTPGYTGSASISTKAMQHGCSVRLLQAWLVPRWISTSPALSSTSPSSISA